MFIMRAWARRAVTQKAVPIIPLRPQDPSASAWEGAWGADVPGAVLSDPARPTGAFLGSSGPSLTPCEQRGGRLQRRDRSAQSVDVSLARARQGPLRGRLEEGVDMGLRINWRRRPPPSSREHRHSENLTVISQTGLFSATAHIRAHLRMDDGTSYPGNRDPNYSDIGRFAFVIQSPPTHLGWGGHVDVEADGYVPVKDVRVVISDSDHELPSVTLAPVAMRRFPAEAGLIHRCGLHFCTADDAFWDWRGATMFTLPARFVAGEDISPQIRWMQEMGVNVARVFVNWDVNWLTAPNRPFERPDYDAALDRFFAHMAAEGLRVEATVITENGRPLGYWRPILQRVFDVAASHWNVFVEVMNEPWQRDIDPVLVMNGVNRHKGRVLAAYGTGPTAIGEEYQPIPTLDYITPHLPRDRHFAHNSKDTLGIRAAVGVPVVDDEPMGIGPPRPRGGRIQDAAAIWSHFAICRLFAAGCTIHTQAGIDGRTPMQAQDPLTHQIVEGIAALWSFVPRYIYTGGYTRAGLSTFALVYRDGDSLVNHAYSSVHGQQQWAVVSVPKPGWMAEAMPGWRIAAVGPVPFVLRLER